MQMSHCTMSSGTVGPRKGLLEETQQRQQIALAVASFNVGAKSVDPLLQSIGLGEGDHTLQALVHKDKLCLYHAAFKDSELHEQVRKRKRHAKKGREETLKARVDTYIAGRCQ